MNANDINTLIQGLKAGDPINIALAIVSALIVVVSLVAIVVSIVLAFMYIKYNRTKNCACITGETAARRILDHYDLRNIKVAVTGSLLFGNSYSHYFKKVRLRRRTCKKDSVASLAMGAQNAALAVLDKENDPDMKKRVRLTPIIDFGPLAFIPLIIIGVALDMYINKSVGAISVICTLIGFLFYLLAFVMSLMVYKTEKKAQERAIEILRETKMANEYEIEDMHKLFKLYNIEYINNIVLSMLRIVYYALKVFAALKGNSSSSKK